LDVAQWSINQAVAIELRGVSHSSVLDMSGQPLGAALVVWTDGSQSMLVVLLLYSSKPQLKGAVSLPAVFVQEQMAWVCHLGQHAMLLRL
jgi:hypothetical protein